MYVIKPLHLVFTVDGSRHTVNEAARYGEKRINLVGNVKCVIADNVAMGLALVWKEIETWLQPKGNVRLNDFTLFTDTEEIIDGTFWGSGQISCGGIRGPNETRND